MMPQFLSIMSSLSDKAFEYVVIGSFIALFLIIIGVMLWRERKRKQSFEAIAKHIGFSYAPEPEEDLLSGLMIFKLFKNGGKIYNFLEGELEEIHWKVFDYRYTICLAGGRNQIHYQTVAYTYIPDYSFPQFCLSQEAFSHRIAEKFGAQDINFKDYPAFSNRYLLQGKSEEEIRQLFTPNVLKFFEEKKSLNHIEASGPTLIYYFPNRIVSSKKLQKFLDEATTAVRLLINK